MAASLNPFSNTSFVVGGVDENKKPREFLVDETGALIVAGGGGGGGSATAANQALQLAKTPEFGVAGTPSADVLSVQGVNGGVPIAAGGITNRVAIEFTRPTDTNAYTIGDVVCNSTSAPAMMTFANAARVNGGTGIILSGRLTTDSATVANGSFRLYLFNATVTATNDNSAWPLVYADLGKRIGFIDFALSAEASGTCAIAQATGVNLDYAAATGSRNLYGILVAKGAYAPASGQKFTLELGVTND